MDLTSQENIWWKYYKKGPGTKAIWDPLPNVKSVFNVGQTVRLIGKPEKARRILRVEWHAFRYEFVYIVETEFSTRYPRDTRIYWFAPQLKLVE